MRLPGLSPVFSTPSNPIRDLSGTPFGPIVEAFNRPGVKLFKEVSEKARIARIKETGTPAGTAPATEGGTASSNNQAKDVGQVKSSLTSGGERRALLGARKASVGSRRKTTLGG